MTVIPCAAKSAMPAKRIVVSVNEIVISRAAIAREIQHHPAATPVAAWTLAARALVVRELLLQEARRLAIKTSPAYDAEGRRETDEEAMVRGLVEQEVQTPVADETACRRYYDLNRARFYSAALYEARHILLPAAPNDAAARGEVRARAAEIISSLRRDPTAFAVMAEMWSGCPSGKTGGNLGQLGPGQTVPEFEYALARMAAGVVHPEPVETRYGVHVVALDRHVSGSELPFEVVRARIGEWLNEKVQRVAIQQYVSILAGRAEIAGIELAASRSPLVQ